MECEYFWWWEKKVLEPEIQRENIWVDRVPRKEPQPPKGASRERGMLGLLDCPEGNEEGRMKTTVNVILYWITDMKM